MPIDINVPLHSHVVSGDCTALGTVHNIYTPIELFPFDDHSIAISVKVFVTTGADHTLRPVAKNTKSADVVLLVFSISIGVFEHFITERFGTFELNAYVRQIYVLCDLLTLSGLKLTHRSVLFPSTEEDFLAVEYLTFVILSDFRHRRQSFTTEKNVFLFAADV